VPEVDADSRDPEWNARNDRLRMLTERALFHNDAAAGREILDIFRPLIRRLVHGVRPERQAEVTANLRCQALMVLRDNITRADQPLAYTLQALRHFYLAEARRIDRETRGEVPLGPLEYQLAHPTAHIDLEEQATAAASHEACLRAIEALRRRALNRRSRSDEMVAMVIEARYFTPGITDREACSVLCFTAGETKTVTEKISRERSNPKSNLFRLAREVLGDDDGPPARFEVPPAGHRTAENKGNDR